MVKAYVVYGLGIGCHNEVAHAYEKAGAKVELVHINQLISGDKSIFDSQILNFPGGFLHGDILGSGMCAANEINQPVLPGDNNLAAQLSIYAEQGNIIYGQCNGFQVLTKLGLLPGIKGDYFRQTVTLAGNTCGVYRVAPVKHKIAKKHFAFDGIDDNDLWLWCRHGEGRILFYSDSGIVPKDTGEMNRMLVNESHVLLRYVDPHTNQPTEEFPHNPNGSVDGIAGLVDVTGNIFGHMSHTEVGIYLSRDPRWMQIKDQLRRRGVRTNELDEKRLEGVALKVFKNIVKHREAY